MIKGERRREIIEAMSFFANDDTISEDDFSETLNNFINGIETELNNALEMLSINDLSDISNIEDAYRIIDNLNDSLY